MSVLKEEIEGIVLDVLSEYTNKTVGLLKKSDDLKLEEISNYPSEFDSVDLACAIEDDLDNELDITVDIDPDTFGLAIGDIIFSITELVTKKG